MAILKLPQSLLLGSPLRHAWRSSLPLHRRQPNLLTRSLSSSSPSSSFLPPIRHRRLPFLPHVSTRGVVAAPRPGGPALLERREDRDLPDVTPKNSYLYQIPIFLAVMATAAALLFNYQRSSSSVVSSTLYACRVHPIARELLGNEIQFNSKVPWISGTLDQLHGKIEISYKIKGSKGETATMTFRSYRKKRMGKFRTEEWSITMQDGLKISLLDEEEMDPVLS